MAISYYDDAILAKIKKWLPANSHFRILTPDESNRFFKLTADDNKDGKFKLPLIAISRNKDISLLSNIKQSKSFDGLTLDKTEHRTIQLNVIPIKPTYQLDIYTKTKIICEEYVREFLLKLINNPKIVIDIPYKDLDLQHVANIRVFDTVSDTSDISERVFAGEFTRYTIQFEIQDAFLFSIPYRKNWHFAVENELEITNDLSEFGDIEVITDTSDSDD